MTEYNKVVYDGQTLIDLTQDDVQASDVRNGVYFHSADGVRSQGTMPTPADYIVEQGTDNSWRYRKWKSGLCECWIKTGKSRSGTSTNFSLTFPFKFAFPPVAAVSGGATGNINAYPAYVQTTTTGIDAYVNASSGSQVWLGIYVCEILA